jgi:hypothetical protein
MKYSILVTFCIVAILNTSYSQEVGKVEYPQLGVSFEIPEGWAGKQGEGIYMIGHNSIPGVVLLIPHESQLSTEQMITECYRGITLGEGTVFRPADKVTETENYVCGDFKGTYQYSPAGAYIIGMANRYGTGLTIVAVTGADSYTSETYSNVSHEVRESVEFSETRTAVQSIMALSGSLADWKYQLGDTKLTYTDSYYSGGEHGGGYNMKEEIHLCKAGHFLYYDQSTVAAGGADVSGYSGSTVQGHGIWDVIDKGGSYILILTFNGGTTREYSLGWGENKELYMNGYRYYRTWEGEYAPDCF